MITIRKPLFSLSCEPRLESQGNWLADLVSSMEAKSSGLHDGMTIQVGWSVTKLIQVGNDLVLHEPDFARNPFDDYRPSVDTTLAVLVTQVDLLSKLKCKGVQARFDDKIVVQRGCLSHDRIYAERAEPKPGDSGWYIGSAERGITSAEPPASSELEAIWVYELLRLRPSVLEALALPVGWLVVWNGTNIEGIADHENRNVYPSVA